MKKTLSAIALTLAVSTAHAGTIAVNQSDFSDTSQWQLNGDTAQLTPNADDALRLTQGYGQAGSAFFLETFNLLNEASFSAFFSFRIFDNVSGGADGFVFTLQPISNTAGAGGGGIGYQGITNSLGIEFDTYDNGGIDGFNDNHAGINFNGDINSVARINEPTDFTNGLLWNVWVDYNGLNDALELRYGMNESRPEFASLTYTTDLEAVFGSSELFVGFTSGTGAAGSTHDITRFSFINTYQPIEETTATSVPEPSTLAVMSLGLFGVAGISRRRKNK